jgi:glycosyltransferase involved in cell wall biosynthesis
MPGRTAILHYASPPGIGGVEAMIGYQAAGLSRAEYAVRILSGAGEALPPPIETFIEPRFSSSHLDVLTLKAELDAGRVPPGFADLRDALQARLTDLLADCDSIIVHNIHTMNKNLPLTAALLAYSEQQPIRQIAYCHDIAALNPQYTAELHPGYPWNLLREAWAGVRYVTISPARQAELAGLFQVDPASIPVITPGVDAGAFFGWTATMRHLARQLDLLEADLLLLVPVRLTRRKNVELALHILAALRAQTALDCRLIVTGPPGPHNPANRAYLESLLALRASLGLGSSAHFLYECGPEPGMPLLVDDPTLSNLYQLADALLFPSLQEGFGIPILEAGLARLPIFCADIPPLRQTAGADAYYFDPAAAPPAEVAAAIWSSLSQSAPYRLGGRVRHNYQWDQIIARQLIPFMEAV